MADTKFLEVKLTGGKLLFVLGNGRKLEFDPRKVNDAMREQGMFHGFNQKIRDAASGFGKEKDFAGAEASMQEVIDALYDNQWKRQGGGASTGVILEDMASAISRMRNVTADQALIAVKKASPEDRTKWAKIPKVALYMAEAKAARLKAASEVEGPDDNMDFGLPAQSEVSAETKPAKGK